MKHTVIKFADNIKLEGCMRTVEDSIKIQNLPKQIEDTIQWRQVQYTVLI